MYILQKNSVTSNYVDDYFIVSHKQEKITLLIESLINGPKKYVFTDEVYISNYLAVNIKKKPDGIFESSQLHLVKKVINHVGLRVSGSLKAR